MNGDSQTVVNPDSRLRTAVFLLGPLLFATGLVGPASALEPSFLPLEHPLPIGSPGAIWPVPFTVKVDIPNRVEREALAELLGGVPNDFLSPLEFQGSTIAGSENHLPLASLQDLAARSIATEIGAIRRELSGGALWEFGRFDLTLPLQTDVPPLTDEFNEVLQRVVAESESSLEPPANLPEHSARSNPVPRKNSNAGGIDSKQSDRILALRGMAREIEMEAADLEDRDEFDQADRQRQLASDLRRVARELASPPMPAGEGGKDAFR